MGLKGSMIVRAAFATLERVAPAGARWAERLWFTLPRRRPVRPMPGGTTFAVSVDGRPALVRAPDRRP